MHLLVRHRGYRVLLPLTRIVAVVVATLHPAPAFAQEPDPELGCTPPGTPDRTSGIVAGTPSPGTWGFSWGGLTTLSDGRVAWADYPVVRKVECDGPAHRAGVRVGDAILEVENADARTSPFPPRIPGKSYKFKLRREEKEFEVTLLTVPRKDHPALL